MNPLRASLAVLLAALAPACGAETPVPSTCDGVGMTAQHASAEGRWLLGAASRYPADTNLGARAAELRTSQRARRAVAWEAVARALAPVPLAQPVPLAGATVPRFRTWYDREDVNRTFQRLYTALSPEARAAGQRFSEDALDEAFGWNARFVASLPEWTADRLNRFAASFDSPDAVSHITGVQRVALSPDTVRHLVNSYPEVVRCLTAGSPPTFVDGPAAPQQLARAPFVLTPCGAQTFGAYFVATGGTLTARADAPGVTLAVLDGVSPTAPARCTAAASTGCQVSGPGTFTVRLTSQGQAADASLDVRYTAPSAEVTACIHGVFPPAAATVAMEWRRVGIGIPFPVYDTSGPAIARRLAPGATATWGQGDDFAEPGDDRVHTMRLASGNTFRLAGMHIRTREVDRWLNITLWWSDAPDTDFGADRPASVRALGAPWTNYKMCVASEFDEQDPDPSGGFDRDAPTLAAALRAVSEGRGGPSWCSNPYIDAGPGLVRSNCVGCHQHAMSGVRPADVQNDITRYPSNGRTQVRNNFPADGFWGLDGGDHVAAVLQEVVDYYRVAR